MKRKSYINKCATICLVLFFVMFLSLVIKICTLTLYEFSNKQLNNKIVRFICDIPEELKTYKVDWEKQYPFNDKTSVNSEESIKDKYISKIEAVKYKIENCCTEKFFKYNYIAELGNRMEKNVGWNLGRNKSQTPVDIGDGYLIKLEEELTKDEISLAQENLINFSQYVEKKGINFLYVQGPYKLSEDVENIDGIYNDYANKNASDFLNGIKDANINFLDLRELIKNKELFFKTDHHWLPSTGLWTAEIISKYLNENFQYNIDINIFDENNYNVETKKNCFLGSAGRAVTLARTKLEDIEIIEPKFETNIDVKMDEFGLDFNNVTWRKGLISDFTLNKKASPYIVNRYSAYAYSNTPHIKIINNNAKDNNKVLILKDSFANCVVPYFCLGVKETEVLDLRAFTGSVKAFIEEYNPDTIVVLYNCASINENSIIKKEEATHNNLWDFK